MAGIALRVVILRFLPVRAYDPGYTQAPGGRHAPRARRLAPGARRAVGRDGENDPVLVVEDRPDTELSIRHRLDHGLDLVVAPEVSLGLGSDPTDRLTELVEKGGWPSQHGP